MPVDRETITGQQVQELRESYGLGRADFAIMCGYPGPSRITNIETKNSWKPGDKDKVADTLLMLERTGAPKKVRKSGRKRGETATERIDRLEEKLREAGKLVREWPTETFFNEDDFPPSVVDIPFVEATDGEGVTNDFYEEDEDPQAIHDVFARLFTNSEVATWQRCRRKWWLAWYRKLALKKHDTLGHRGTGIRVHNALAAWYVPEGYPRTDPRVALQAAQDRDWELLVNELMTDQWQDQDLALATLRQSFDEAVTLEKAMIEGYTEWLSETGADANLEVISPETALIATIDGTVGDDKVRVTLAGRLDVRTRRTVDDVRLYVDHKTVGNFADVRKTLHMDPQMLHYHILEWLNTPEGEARCEGALYNMLRKVKRTARAKPPFFERIEVRHNEFELDAYRRRLLGVARDVQRAGSELTAGEDPMSVVYPNPTRTCSWDCDFFVICPMFDDGSRVDDAIASLYEEADPLTRYDDVKMEAGI